MASAAAYKKRHFICVWFSPRPLPRPLRQKVNRKPWGTPNPAGGGASPPPHHCLRTTMNDKNHLLISQVSLSHVIERQTEDQKTFMRQFFSSLRPTLRPPAECHFYIQEPNIGGYDFSFQKKSEYIVGRFVGNDSFATIQVPLKDPLVSRTHCRIFWEKELGWMLEDLDSSSGTWTKPAEEQTSNWSRVTCPAPLISGTSILAGHSILTMNLFQRNTLFGCLARINSKTFKKAV